MAKKSSEKILEKDKQALGNVSEHMKTLNSQIKEIESSKKGLVADINSLKNRIKGYEKYDLKDFNKLMGDLKSEFTKDFMPILKKFDLSSYKSKINDELLKIVEVELKKFESGFKSKDKKEKEDLYKKLSELEYSVNNALKENKVFQNELKKVNNDYIVKKINEDLSLKLKDIILKVKSNNDKFICYDDEIIVNLGNDVKKAQTGIKSLEKKIDNRLDLIDNNLKDLESREVSLELDERTRNQILKEADVVGIKDEILKIKEQISLYKSELSNVKEDLSSFFEKRVEVFNKKFEEFAKQKKIDSKIAEDLKVLNSKFIELNHKTTDFKEDVFNKIPVIVDDFLSAKDLDLVKDFKDFKVEFNQKFKDYKAELKKVSLELEKKQVLKFDKKIDKNSEQTKKVLDKFYKDLNKVEDSFKSELKKYEKKFEDYSNDKLSKVLVENIKVLEDNFSKDKKDFENYLVEQQKIEVEALEEKFNSYIEKITLGLNDLVTRFESEKSYFEEVVGNRFNVAKEEFALGLEEWKSKISEDYNLKLKEISVLINEQRDVLKKDEDILKSKIDELEKITDDYESSFASIEENLFSKINEKFNFKFNEVNDLLVHNREFIDEKLENIGSQVRQTFDSTIAQKSKEFESFIKQSNLDSYEDLNAQIKKSILKFHNEIDEIVQNINSKKNYLEESIENKMVLSRQQLEQDLSNFKKDYTILFDKKLIEVDDFYRDKSKVFTCLEDDIKISKKEFKELSKLCAKDIENNKKSIDKFTKIAETKNREHDEELKLLIKEKLDHFQECYENYIKAMELVREEQVDEIKSVEDKFKREIYDTIDKERDVFRENENSFKEIFKEKVENLHEIIENKFYKYKKELIDRADDLIGFLVEEKTLDLVEKKKDLDKFKEKLQEDVDYIKDYNIKIEKLVIEIEKNLVASKKQTQDEIKAFKINFIKDIKGLIYSLQDEINMTFNVQKKELAKHLNNYNESVKSYNERFLRYDEQLGKLGEKMYNIDKSLFELHYEFRDEIEKKISHESFGSEQVIRTMASYEQSLVFLINDLLEKGIEQNKIYDILAKKGHPIFYVKFVFNEIRTKNRIDVSSHKKTDSKKKMNQRLN